MEKEKGLEIKSMHIKYVFTDDEKKDIASNLAEKTSEKLALEDKKKEVSSQIQGDINAANAAMSRYSKEYNQGYTWKNHDCYEVFDYDDKQVHTHRADTHDLVDTRVMRSSEFQRDMFNPTEKITEGEKLIEGHSEAVQIAIRYKKEYAAQFTQACKELTFLDDAEQFSDVAAIKVCEIVKEILDSEIPDENPEDV